MRITISLILTLTLAALTCGQKLVSPSVDGRTVPDASLLRIVKAEDSRDPAAVNAMLGDTNVATRYRAAMAAGRIGSESSVAGLVKLLDDDSSSVRESAAFALGEVESISAADAVRGRLERFAEGLSKGETPGPIARLVEAAGKIAAANSTTPAAKELGRVIVDVLKADAGNPNRQGRSTLLLAITAALRARPEGGAAAVVKFISHNDARVRADALNCLARLRAKEDLGEVRSLLRRDPDPIVRANAARVLAAAEDKEAYPLLLDYAINGDDSRVRVACIRALASLKDARAVDHLIERGRVLMKAYSAKNPNPAERTELLEIAMALGRLLERMEDKRAIGFLSDLRDRDGYSSAEVEIAYAHIAPKAYVDSVAAPTTAYRNWRQASVYGQGLADVAATKDSELIAKAGMKLTEFITGMGTRVRRADEGAMLLAMPDLTTAMAALKPGNLDEILRGQLTNEDVFIRAAAAGAIADQPAAKDNVDALNKAFIKARLTDKHDNDAKLAIMDAIAKLDRKAGVGSFLMALDDPDYLIRKKAFDILGDAELQKSFPGIASSLENARKSNKDQVLPYSRAAGTFLGQILNKDIDYRRALSRMNGSIKAVLTTEKGKFTIVFNPEEAPLTVDNFVQLARKGYFNGLTVHRVVGNFVMQDGDPRGDGNGGPGLSIRCEINMLPYDRGAVGMALSGKDTGGSQWFVTHSPQPHLDGGYTVFGHVSERDMKVVDSIVRGDRILRVSIIGR